MSGIGFDPDGWYEVGYLSEPVVMSARVCTDEVEVVSSVAIATVVNRAATEMQRVYSLTLSILDQMAGLIAGSLYDDTMLAAMRFRSQSDVLKPLVRPASCDPQPVIDKIDELVNESLEQGWFEAK